MADKEVKPAVPMNISTRSEGGMTSIACPSCGAGAAFNQPGCAHCGSGLLKNTQTDLGTFGVPNNATFWKLGEQYTDNDTLTEILASMQQNTPEGQYSYVVWKGLPAVVGGEIDAKKSLENYSELRKEVEREKLGRKWTRALDEFHNLQVDLGMMDDEQVLGLRDRFKAEVEEHGLYDPDANLFFEETTFRNFELFMHSLPQHGDHADNLRAGIKEVRGLMAPRPES